MKLRYDMKFIDFGFRLLKNRAKYVKECNPLGIRALIRIRILISDSLISGTDLSWGILELLE